MRAEDFGIDDAIEWAARAHRGQRDKGRPTLPYLTHPMRVMSAFDDPVQQMIAILHDAVEDSEGTVTLELLRQDGAPERVLAGIAAMTHHDDESNETYWSRVRENPDALQVKLADVADNADPARLALLPDEQAQRLATKYVAARQALTDDRPIARDEPSPPMTVPVSGRRQQSVWPSIVSDDAQRMRDWLLGLGFTLDLWLDGEREGSVHHSQLDWPDGGRVVLSSTGERATPVLPGTNWIHVVTEAPDEVFERARHLDARVIHELVDQTDYPAREFTIADPDGNHWTFSTFAG